MESSARQRIESFEAQASIPGLVVGLQRYAQHRSRMVGVTDVFYARELVQDAIGDTVMGVLHWDPARVTLKKHLFDAIKSRTRHHYVRHLRLRHLPLELCEAELEQRLAERDANADACVHERAAQTLASLRELATSDRDVLLLLGAFENGATKRGELMARTQLTARRYEAARRRMRRHARRLASEARPVARDPGVSAIHP